MTYDYYTNYYKSHVKSPGTDILTSEFYKFVWINQNNIKLDSLDYQLSTLLLSETQNKEEIRALIHIKASESFVFETVEILAKRSRVDLPNDCLLN